MFRSIVPKKGEYTISLLDCLSLFVAINAIVALTALFFGIFHPLATGIVAAGISIILFFVVKPRLILKWDKTVLLILTILLLIGLGLRVPINLYVSGGQDQGVYVNMSKIYEIYGDTYFSEEIGANLTEDLRKVYKDNKNEQHPRLFQVEENRYYLGFYPLHPLFMAQTAALFGDEARVYSLLFFSLLSIVVMYVLTYVLSRDRWAAILASLFLTLLPAHLFFTKFPVTEVQSLAFILLGLLYAFLAFKEKNKKQEILYLVLSFLMFFCFIFTRLTMLLYIPLIVLLVITIQTVKPSRVIVWSTYAGGIIGAIAVSFMYYSVKIPFLVTYAFDEKIFTVLSNYWMIFTAVAGISGVFLFFVYRQRKKVFRYLKTKLPLHMPYYNLLLVAAIIVITIYNGHTLLFTDKLNSFAQLEFFHFGGQGALVLTSLLLYVTAMHVFPPLLILFFSSILIKKVRTNAVLLTVQLFGLYFLIFYSFHPKIITYQFYYTRYLLTEILPGIIIFTSIVLCFFLRSPNRPLRFFSMVCIGTALLYYGMLSFHQIGKNEGPDITMYKELSAQADEDDVIVLYDLTHFPLYDIEAALRFYYQENTFKLSKAYPDGETIIRELDKEFDDVIIVAIRGLPFGLEAANSEIDTYQFGMYKSGKKHLYSGLQKPYELTTYEYLYGVPFKHHTLTRKVHIYTVNNY